MNPVAIVPPTAMLMYPVEIKTGGALRRTDDHLWWNDRVRAFNRGQR